MTAPNPPALRGEDENKEKRNSVQWSLWRQFLPLSLSDVVMAVGDPMQTIALARLPNAQVNLGALGVVKALAVFLESPIIMMLHASTAMSRRSSSYAALGRFMVLLGLLLSATMLVLAWGPVFDSLVVTLFGISPELASVAKPALAIMCIWPMAIAWRRYYQGLLIRLGKSRFVARASLFRLAFIAMLLFAGVWRGWNGAILAATALAGGVLVEALAVSFLARGLSETLPKDETLGATGSDALSLPVTLKGVGAYYAPLATTMIMVWGGRALLVGLVARSGDGVLALAAWPAAWGFVLTIANSTRMVQQVVISRDGKTAQQDLARFVLCVGGVASSLLAILAYTGPGEALLSTLLGSEGALLDSIVLVLRVATPVPLLVAVQNGLQAALILRKRNWQVNQATVLGVVVMLAVTWALIVSGGEGAPAAAWGMLVGLSIEAAALCAQVRTTSA